MLSNYWLKLHILTISNYLVYGHDLIQIGRISLFYCPVLSIIYVKIFPTKTRLFRPPARIVRAPHSIVILTISFILYSFILATSQLFSYLISFGWISDMKKLWKGVWRAVTPMLVFCCLFVIRKVTEWICMKLEYFPNDDWSFWKSGRSSL